MLRARVPNAIVLLEWALVTTNEVDRPTISTLNGIRINMVALPQETLYILQNSITTELLARESRALQVLREKNINME